MKPLNQSKMEALNAQGPWACTLGIGLAAAFSGISLGGSFFIAVGMCSLS